MILLLFLIMIADLGKYGNFLTYISYIILFTVKNF